MTQNNTPPVQSNIIAALVRLAAAINHEAWGRADRQGLSPTQDRILTFLASRGEGKSLSAIAEELGVSAATASDSVASLVDKGLLRKQAAKDDARRKIIELTAAGRKQVKTTEDWSEFLGEAVQQLPRARQADFLQSLSQIILSLQRQGRVPITRMCVSCRFFKAASGEEDAHYCRLLQAPLAKADLRIDCPEHDPETP